MTHRSWTRARLAGLACTFLAARGGGGGIVAEPGSPPQDASGGTVEAEPITAGKRG